MANFLSGNGLGVHRERAVLQNWECGQDRVALVMHNDLYPDMVVGCLKARTVPVNVNYHYTPREVGELFDYLRPRAVIYHRGLGPKFADVLGRGDVDLLIAVDDGSEAAQLPGAVSLDDALAQGDTGHPVPGSPDDLLMICTGGTTGRPKGCCGASPTSTCRRWWGRITPALRRSATRSAAPLGRRGSPSRR